MLYMAQVVRLKCFSVFTPIDIGKSFSHMTPPTHVFDMKSMCRNTHDASIKSNHRQLVARHQLHPWILHPSYKSVWTQVLRM